MILPRIVGSVPRRYDLQKSQFTFNTRPSLPRGSYTLSSSPQARYSESVDLAECKLLNAKKRSTFTKRYEASDIYRSSFQHLDREQCRARELKALYSKKAVLDAKRLAFEAKLAAAAQITRNYGVQFKRTELRLLNLDNLEVLAKRLYTERRRIYASKIIQKCWRKHRIFLKKVREARRQNYAAIVIQKAWRRYKVLMEMKKLKVATGAKVFPIQTRIRGLLVRIEHTDQYNRYILDQNLKFFQKYFTQMGIYSANTIRKNWNAFKLRKSLNERIAKRKVKVKVVTKRIFPGYLKSTAASRMMRKKETTKAEDMPNELKLRVEESAEETPAIVENPELGEEDEEVEREAGEEVPQLETLQTQETPWSDISDISIAH
mmetsp:Transcript_7905/g.15330  ORF Transcript_7905/g.15330 Transcript_7905/m.15330 type:complete len:376 (-) Transcript_7905:7183-8310(-)